MDDILNRKQEVLSKIYSFLEVRSDFVPKGIDILENRSGYYKSPLLLNIISTFTKFFRCKIKMGFVIDFFKTIGLAGLVKRINKQEVNYPEMSKDLRQELIKYYKENNRKLTRLLNRNLNDWNK